MLPSHVRLILVVVVVVLVIVVADVVGAVVAVVDGVGIVVAAVLSGEHNFRDVGVIGLGVVVCLQFLFAARIGFLEMYFVVGWCCRVWWCW